MPDKKNLFKNIKIKDESVNYDLIDDSLHLQLDAVARVTAHSFYVIDYFKRAFTYVSPNPLFLCGHTQNEVLEAEFGFFEKIMPPDDFELFTEINNKSIDFYNLQPLNTRQGLILTFDIRLIHPNNRLLFVNFKITPYTTSLAGDLWLSLGMISLSSQKTVGNAYVINENIPERYEYSLKSQKWNLVNSLTLNTREKEILLYSAQGFRNDEIAKRLFVDVNTVKFHKRKLFDKFGVKNIIEAIRFAYNYKLI